MPGMKECYPGHSRCYTTDQSCKYSLHDTLKNLLYCRNGQHLQYCSNSPCEEMYKCPNSYCVPYRYVCDGRWDCWHGEDEINCVNRSCINMFKCRHSAICLHVADICNGLPDCYMEDDEALCRVKDCLDACSCVSFAVKCVAANITLLRIVILFHFVI